MSAAVYDWAPESDYSDPIVAPSATSRWGFALTCLVAIVWIASLAIGFRFGVAAITVLGYGCILLGFIRPAIGLLGIGMLCTLDAITREFLMTGGLLRYNTLNYVLFLIAVLFSPLLLRRNNLQFTLGLAFAVILMFQLGHSPSRGTGAIYFLNFAAYFGLLALCYRADFDPAVWSWLGLLCGLVGAAGGLVFYLHGHQVSMNENAAAYMPATAIFTICLSAPFVTGKRGHTALWILAAINFCWVFLTGSRGTLLVVMAALAFFLFHSRSRLGLRIVVLGVAAGLCLMILSAFSELQAYSVGRVAKLFDSSRSIANRTSGRVQLALRAGRVFRAKPFGAGTGGFISQSRRARARELGSRHGLALAHSGWMRTLAENGVLGFPLLAAFVLSFGQTGYRRRHLGLLPVGLVVTACLSLALMFTEFQPKGLWLLAAIGTVMLNGHLPEDDEFDLEA